MGTAEKRFGQRLAAISEKIEAQHAKSKKALQHAQAALKHSEAARGHASHPTFNSWKEIAAYLGRGVRTVQRWERELQLPVHRIGNGRHAPVYATISELKFWMMTSGVGELKVVHDREPMVSDSPRREAAELTARLNALAQTLAEASVHHRGQAEALKKNIVALRASFARHKSR